MNIKSEEEMRFKMSKHKTEVQVKHSQGFEAYSELHSPQEKLNHTKI